jgi:hypothetical protein
MENPPSRPVLTVVLTSVLTLTPMTLGLTSMTLALTPMTKAQLMSSMPALVVLLLMVLKSVLTVLTSVPAPVLTLGLAAWPPTLTGSSRI